MGLAGQLQNWADSKIRRSFVPVPYAHESQETWTPPDAASLWVKISNPSEEWPPWAQPIGAMDAYPLGARVRHKGEHWASAVENNVWEPGVFGWEAESNG